MGCCRKVNQMTQEIEKLLERFNQNWVDMDILIRDWISY